MPSRGWIIPVGGTTPDRHKVGTLPLCWLRGVQPPTVTRSGTLPLCWLRNADYQIPVRSIGQDLLLPVGNNAGRGLNPRPERSTPAKYLLKLSNARNAPPRQVSVYASEFVPPSLAQPFPFPSPLQCSCVGGSFRSGMQSPTGTRPERSPFAGCGMLIIKYRLGASVRICFCRSATMPVGGSTPDRHKADRLRGDLN